MSFVWSCRVVDWASDLQSCSILTFLFGNRIPLVLLSGQDTNRLNKWESKKIIGLLGAWMASTGYNLRVSCYTATTKQSKLALWILQLVNCRGVLAQAGVCKSGKFLAPTHEHCSEITLCFLMIYFILTGGYGSGDPHAWSRSTVASHVCVTYHNGWI